MPKQYKSDAQLLQQHKLVEAAKTDPSKFEDLYNTYHEPIFRFVYQRLNSKDAAFDITQQVFTKALANIKKYKFKGVPFSAWLYRIASNELNTFFKTNQHQRTINIDTLAADTIVEDIQEDNSDELIDRLIQQLHLLKHSELMLIEMRYFEKRPFKEISAILDITESNAKVKVYRIIDKLRLKFNINLSANL